MSNYNKKYSPWIISMCAVLVCILVPLTIYMSSEHVILHLILDVLALFFSLFLVLYIAFINDSPKS